MSRITDQKYLKSQQYKTSSDLDARIQLHKWFSINKYGWPKWVFDHFVLPTNCCLLELGCGTGYLWLQNIDRISDGWEITLSDFSRGMLRKTEFNLQAVTDAFYFVVADVQNLPWVSESYDAVIANHMLFHVPNKAKALSEINRVLKPGGKLYAATNGPNHLNELFGLIQTIDPDAYQERHPIEFGLENGREQLSEYFSEINLFIYKDALVVTEVEPLIFYILSTQCSQIINNNQTELVSLIEQKMKSKGYIYITKSLGMFEAKK